MEIRPFQPADAPALVELSAWCARGESDFVLNPYWEREDELFAEFRRFGIEPSEHLLVADSGDGERLGLAGFLRLPKASAAALYCPIVKPSARGRGLGGELILALPEGVQHEVVLAARAPSGELDEPRGVVGLEGPDLHPWASGGEYAPLQPDPPTRRRIAWTNCARSGPLPRRIWK